MLMHFKDERFSTIHHFSAHFQAQVIFAKDLQRLIITECSGLEGTSVGHLVQ